MSSRGPKMDLKMIPQEKNSNRICRKSYAHQTQKPSFIHIKSIALVTFVLVLANQLVLNYLRSSTTDSYLLLASGHIVLAKDDRGQHLVLTGEDGGKGKGKGGGDQLVIAGNRMGGDGQDSQMVMQDAANREGDIVMNGKSWIIPGEDGHIVLADSRNQNQDSQPQQPPINPLIFWAPYMNNRFYSRMMSAGFMPYLG